jgi:hypothetical protein
MSRKKKLGDAAKVLGGLGAAYVASEFAKPTVVDLGSPFKRDPEEDLERQRAFERLQASTDSLAKTLPPNFLKKDGGVVKGWGKARGARAAKVY